MNKETTEMNALQVQLPPDISVEEARLLLMVKLFETGRVTLGQAAKLAGYSKPTFIELLGKMGVPVIDYPAEDLQQEINL
jgi:predicted HTH domain antitoxin